MNFLLPPYGKRHIIVLASITFFLAIGLLFIWKQTSEQQPAITQTKVVQTNPQQLKQEFSQPLESIQQGKFDVAVDLNKFIILDIRSAQAYDQSHIKGSLSNPIDQLPASSFSNSMKVAVYSDNQQDLQTAAKILKDKEVSEVHLIDAAIDQLESQGYALERAQ